MCKTKRFFLSILIFIAIVISGSKTYAKTGILDNVVISDKNSGYEIVINADKPASYSVSKISADKVIVKIKDVFATDKTDAIYKNASNIEHVIIKPVFNGTDIEITGKNASNSSVTLSKGLADTNSNTFIPITVLTLLTIILSVNKRRKHHEFKGTISIVDEENKILKVAFESKNGLIARAAKARTITPHTQNIRKVSFNDDEKIREYNIM